MAKCLKPVELFLTIGLAAAVGACGSSAVDSGEGGEGEQPSAAVTAEESEGGEGGEGGEGSASGNPDTDYMTSLALMKGHLIVARELLEVGNYEEAEPHIGHPVEELYGGVEAKLDELNAPQFKAELNELNDLVKSAPDSDQVGIQFETSMSAIDEAISALPEDQRQSPEFVLQAIVKVLQTAAEEYEAAIINNQIVEAVEYQDSRGFILYADELYQTIADEMQQTRPEDHTVITDNLQALQTIWPSVIPPETPVQPPSKVYSLVSQIELQI